MSQHVLHIVSFDVPFPADYGGAIDVFYRIKALSDAGVEIHLHAYHYGRTPAKELKQLCKSVTYYHRNNTLAKQLSILPFVVASRNNEQLLKNLLKDDHPILFEGLHTCYFINHPSLKKREKIIRMHNVEHDYYSYLGQHEPKLWKRTFYKLEAGKLRRYEKTISHANKLVTISEGDYYYYKKIHPNAYYIPGSHPYNTVSSKPGKGDFILYHGNLSVPENIESVHFILDEIAQHTHHKIIITGKNPVKSLTEKAKLIPNVNMIENPDNATMNQLIQDAHIHLLPSAQNTGLKLKLLYSLFSGRFVIANQTTVDNSGLENLCIINNSGEKMLESINQFMKTEFTEQIVDERKIGLKPYLPSTFQQQWKQIIFG